MTLNRLIALHGLDKLNSATKYPSILTYHAMGEKGTLTSELAKGEDFNGLPVIVTEKVDGTNARILLDETGDFIIGSREDLLYAKGDRIWSRKQPILAQLLNDTFLRAVGTLPVKGVIVIFGEVYGAKINRGYTDRAGFMLFDSMTLVPENLNGSLTDIAVWREEGGQSFHSQDTLVAYAALAPMVPVLHADEVTGPPADLEGAYEYVRKWLPKSRVGGVERPEGIIVRSPDRRMIRKLRFQDYEKTFRRQTRA